MKHSLASLALHLEPEGPPYYQQLIEQIKAALLSQRLAPTDKLPSSRQLANTLGVSRSTVTRAYDQLIAEGFLVSEAKRGLFASANAIALLPRSRPASHSFTATKAPPLRCDSGVDAHAFPAREWAASMRRSWLKPDIAVLQGSYRSGFPPLKEAIADYLFRLRGLHCSAEQVFVTAGNRDSLITLQHCLDAQQPEAQWWLEDPTYPAMRALMSARSGGIKSLTIDQEGAQLPDSSGSNPIAILTPNRQYPLGVQMSASRRQDWLSALNTGQQWLIEDDYDNEFVYQGRMGVPLMQADTTGRIFLVGSFSKVLFRGLRLGFVVAPLSQCEHFERAQERLGASASLPIQPALVDFMQHGNFDRHLNRMRRLYRVKRDQLLTLLQNHLHRVFDWQTPHGGMHIVLTFKADWLNKRPHKLWDQHLAQSLRPKGISLTTLSSHYAIERSACQGFLLGFSNPDQNTMLTVVTALKAEVNRL